jgi:ATP-dependent helicase/DNAse subunit B
VAKNPAELNLGPSKLDVFQGCRRLFKYRYILELPQRENKYFLIGNIAHHALENFHKVAKPTDKLSPLMLAAFKNSYINNHAQQNLNRRVISREDLFSVREMLSSYLKYVKTKGFPNVYCLEKLAKLEIGGATVWLKSDRVDKIGDDTYRVIDYKSGKPATKKAELASVQLPSYGIWIRKKISKTAKIVGEYFYLKHLNASGVHSYEITDDMMAETEETYRKVSADLKNKDFQYTQNFNYKYCFSCDFKTRCLGDEEDGLS